MSAAVERAMRQLDKLACSTSDAEKIASARRAVEYAAANMTRSAHVVEVSDSRECNAFSFKWWGYVDISWRWRARAEHVHVLLRIGRGYNLREPVVYACSAQWRPKWREGGVSRHEKFYGEEELAFVWIVHVSEQALEKVDEDLRGRGRR